MDKQVDPGRPGEPWIWTDTRTGTQIPLSYRGWQGTYDPRALEISAWDFVLKFGRHLPGGGPGEQRPAEPEKPPAPPADASTGAEGSDGDDQEEPESAAEQSGEVSSGRWNLSGQLDLDCMICHRNDRMYSGEQWSNQVSNQNFAWAPTAASGLGYVEGKVSSLPDSFDPAAAPENSTAKLPLTTYAQHRVNGEKKVFFDVIRSPHNDACYYCHTTRLVGEKVAPQWVHDEDVHLRAGMTCADCHPNGIDHHTVRGFEGETHPSGQPVTSLSCRGCHYGELPGGRLGAPLPLHKGLPQLHLDKLSCTACHCGPRPSEQAVQVLTAMAHGLGLPSHDYTAETAPGIVTPVLMQDGHTLYPYRMMWPAFWGQLKEDKITPLNPDKVYDALRRTLRVRTGETFAATVSQVRLSSDDKGKLLGDERAKVAESELTDEEKSKLAALEKQKAGEIFRQKLAEALAALQEIITDEGAKPVYLSGGKAYRAASDAGVETFEHDAARPYAWKLAHDVRPARWSSGATGCAECHAAGTPLFEGTVTAIGQAPDAAPITQAMHEIAGYDKTRLDAWNASFLGRTAFKWVGFFSLGVVGLIVFAYVLFGSDGLLGTALSYRPSFANSRPVKTWAMLVYVFTLLSVVVSGVTGIVSWIRFDALDGWMLFAHMAGAGLLVVALPLFAITWCDVNRFHGRQVGHTAAADYVERFSGLTKLMFWIVLASGLIAAATMLLSMLPMFGTETLDRLLEIHLYSGLVMVVAVVLHLFGLLPKRGHRP
jgi:hypothetical protein